MLSGNTELRQSSQFLLPADLGKLSSRQTRVLCANVPSRQSHNVDLISVCLKHRQGAMRHRIIVRMRTDEQDRFPGPFVDRDFRFVRTLLGRGQRREQKDKTNKEHLLHRTSPMSWLTASFDVDCLDVCRQLLQILLSHKAGPRADKEACVRLWLLPEGPADGQEMRQ